jgi:hypothetical protein
VDSNNNAHFTGLQSDALNVVASNQTYDGSNESTMTKSGTAITLLNVNVFEGVTYNYSYDTAARLTRLQSTYSDANHPGTLLTVNQYNPLGELQQATLGNGRFCRETPLQTEVAEKNEGFDFGGFSGSTSKIEGAYTCSSQSASAAASASRSKGSSYFGMLIRSLSLGISPSLDAQRTRRDSGHIDNHRCILRVVTPALLPNARRRRKLRAEVDRQLYARILPTWTGPYSNQTNVARARLGRRTSSIRSH